MKRRGILGVLGALATLTLMACSTPSAEFSAQEKQALEARVASFSRAVKQNDVRGILSVTPPKMTALLAQRAGMSETRLRALTERQMRAALAQVQTLAFSISVAEATSAQTRSGRPYMLLPTQTRMRIAGTTMQADSQTLAFIDEGTWYLVRIDDKQQTGLLTQAYPEFRGVKFPKGSIRVVGR